MSETATQTPSAPTSTSTPETSQTPSQGTGEPGTGSATPSGTGTPPGTPQAQAKRLLKLQHEGKITEMDAESALNLLIEEHGEDAIVNATQISRAAREKMRLASQRERELREAAEDIRDPKRLTQLLKKNGWDSNKIRAHFEELYAEDLNDRMTPPEEKERRALKAELDQLRAEKQRVERERLESTRKTAAETAQKTIGAAFTAALKEAGLDGTPFQLARMAAHAEQLHLSGERYDPAIHPKILAKEIAQEYEQGEISSYIRGLKSNPERLAKVIGEEGMRALRKWDVDRVKAKQGAQTPGAAPRVPGANRAPTPGNKPKPAMDIDAYYESLKGSQ